MKNHLIPLVNIDHNSHVIKKWHRFVKFGERPTGVNEKVIHSWERSKELKVDAYGGRSSVILTSEELEKKLEQYKPLINITLPYINNIVQTIKGLGYIVFLTDGDTNILYVSGDKDVLEDFKHIFNFKVGAAWSEKAVGTTAVSMVISNNNAVPFMADEKYCYELKKRACSAVPIRNMDGDIIAILGIAAGFATPNAQLSGILLAAEMAIENQLRMMKMNEKFRLVNEYYKTIFNSVSDAIIAVDHNGMITELNQNALEILREDSDKLIGKKAEAVLGFYPVILDVLKTGREFSQNYVLKDTKDKKMLYKVKRIIPIFNDNNRVDGCIKKKKKIETKKMKTRKGFLFENIIGRSE
ncbi:MAG: PAS domain-containing protein, partial [Clostridia bacterium]|nr:PAS domain-containing protein [Clostridia bacterium]